MNDSGPDLAQLLHDIVGEPPRAVTIEQVADKVRSRHGHTRAIVLPTIAAVVVALVAIGLTIINPSAKPTTHPGSPSLAAGEVTTVVNADLTIRHPAAWRYVASSINSDGPSATVGYLTNDPSLNPNPPCHASASGSIQCGGGPPASPLPNGGIVITISENFLAPRYVLHQTQTISGYPARVETVGPSGCTTGATTQVQAQVLFARPGSTILSSTISMTACFADPIQQNLHDFHTMLDTATIQPH